VSERCQSPRNVAEKAGRNVTISSAALNKGEDLSSIVQACVTAPELD
jgi:hypothetical protein